MSVYFGWVSYEIDRRHREDRLREARLNRLESMGLAAEPVTDSSISRLLYRIGETMSAWGASLKKRSSHADELKLSPASDCQ